MHLQSSNIYQVLRSFDSLEYQLKLSSIFRSVSTIRNTDPKHCNIKEAVAATDDNVCTQQRKRKCNEEAVHQSARPTKKTKCTESTTQSKV